MKYNAKILVIIIFFLLGFVSILIINRNNQSKNIRILQKSHANNINCISPGRNYCPLNPELGPNYTVIYGPGLDK